MRESPRDNSFTERAPQIEHKVATVLTAPPDPFVVSCRCGSVSVAVKIFITVGERAAVGAAEFRLRLTPSPSLSTKKLVVLLKPPPILPLSGARRTRLPPTRVFVLARPATPLPPRPQTVVASVWRRCL